MFQTLAYDLFRKMLGSGPVYATLGNHDTYNQYVTSLSRDTYFSYLAFSELRTLPIPSVGPLPNSSVGTTITLLDSGNTKIGYPNLLFNLPKPTMLLTWSGGKTV